MPYFALMGHQCRFAPGQVPGPASWTKLERDPDVVTYQEALTQWTLSQLGTNDELEVVVEDKLVGKVRVGRES